MSLEKISSKNATYQKFEVLQSNRNKRHKYNEFLIEGVRNINEAIRNNWKIHSFIYSVDKPLSSWATNVLENVETTINFGLTEDLMNELSKKDETSELLAIVQCKTRINFLTFVQKIQLSHYLTGLLIKAI